MLIKNNEIVAIVGQPGHGKSFLAKVILASFERHVVFDPMNEYGFNPHKNEKKFCPFNLNRVVPTKKSDFDTFLSDVWNRGNIVVGVDEIDTLIGKDRDLEGDAYRLVHLHYHRNLGMVAVARRTQNLHKDILSCADHIFVFRLFIKNDIEWLKDTIGDDALKARDLPPRHFLHYSEGVTEVCPPISAPDLESQHIEKAPGSSSGVAPESSGPRPTPKEDEDEI